MRAFQYKILLRIIPTNKYLKVCNIIDNGSCYFCHSEVETIEHLFYLCPIVKELWVNLAENMRPYLDITPFYHKMFCWVVFRVSIKCALTTYLTS